MRSRRVSRIKTWKSQGFEPLCGNQIGGSILNGYVTQSVTFHGKRRGSDRSGRLYSCQLKDSVNPKGAAGAAAGLQTPEIVQACRAFSVSTFTPMSVPSVARLR